MGAEARCSATVNGETAEGRAQLETDTLFFRAPGLKIAWPFRTMKSVAARDGRLFVTTAAGTLSLELGDAAAKWAEKIRNPPSRLAKIGVKYGSRAAAVGPVEPAFLAELKAGGVAVTTGRARKDADAIFLGAATLADLGKVPALKRSLKPDGALWIVRPKGHAEITERAVMAAGKAAGLVDVKVVAFSSTHTAEKFVIRVKDR